VNEKEEERRRRKKEEGRGGGGERRRRRRRRRRGGREKGGRENELELELDTLGFGKSGQWGFIWKKSIAKSIFKMNIYGIV
jgi:hypothetical protein